jgi:hypothetical protein
MVHVQSANLGWLNHIRDSATEDMTQFELPRLLPKGPCVLKSDWSLQRPASTALAML